MKLPIGIQSFQEIRSPEHNYVYIDKTHFAHRLATTNKYYFLSRPRRFGKSLFLDTLSELFKGSKSLFEGLYIYQHWDWNRQFPVLKFSFASGDFSSEESIKLKIRTVIFQHIKNYQLDADTINSPDLGIMMEQLIVQLSQKLQKQVVVLIDEYDKPILDNIQKENKANAIAAREILRNFYSPLKECDVHLRMVFITGVSKFSKLSLFSGLNNIEDITLDSRFATITGYTHLDLQNEFAAYSEGTDLNKVRCWYNGYNYFGEPIYNPYDILLFFSQGNRFKSYWWETGNPRFLIDKLKEQPYFLPDLENKLVSEEMLNSFDVEHIDLVALLWQTGYLTFDMQKTKRDDEFYRMKVPNLEVQKSLNHLFFGYLSNISHATPELASACTQAINSQDIDGIILSLNRMFASIPYDNYTKNNIAKFEGYYASVTYAFLASLSFTVQPEDKNSTGRIDLSIISSDAIYIIEYKVDRSSENALQQIKTKRYFEKYAGSGKAIFLIGLKFDSVSRKISDFAYEKV